MRLANLRSGQLDLIERLPPSDIAGLKADSCFKVSRITEIGYQGITINVGKSDMSQTTVGRIRACVKHSSFPSIAKASCRWRRKAKACRQPMGLAGEPLLLPRAMPVPKRDVARAKALLKEAGVPNPSLHAR